MAKRIELMIVDPKEICFNPEYGESDQFATVYVESQLEKEHMAYKVDTNRPQFYNVTPSRKILGPKERSEVEIKLKKTFTQTDFLSSAKSHRFDVLAVIWPPERSQFCTELWKKLKNEKLPTGDVQIQRISVDLDKGNAGAAGKVKPTVLKFNDGGGGKDNKSSTNKADSTEDDDSQ